MKKVLVLGAVQGEVPLVKAFQDMGYYVIVAGKGSNYPCCSIADKFYDIDIMDYNLVLSIAKEESVCAVTSNVVERAIRIAAWVTDQLGLEGIGYDTAQVFTNKYKMRVAAEKVGVGVPSYAEVSNVEQALEFANQHAYPLMIKPVDNGGAKGVTKVHNKDELIRNFQHSLDMSVSDGKVIIEQFIEGEEFIVDAFTHNYICDNTNVSTKETFDIADLCIVKNVVLQDAQTCTSRIEQMLLAENKKLVEGIGLKFGITHANYIYQKQEDKVYLVEITSRGGGDYISSHLVELATGVNVSKLLAQYSLGIDVIGSRHLDIHQGSAAWFGFALPEGEISCVEGVEDIRALNGVYDIIDSGFFVGKKVKRIIDASGKFGPVLVYGKTREECKEVMEKVKALLKVEVMTEQGVKGVIW